MLDGIQRIAPEAAIGHIGLYATRKRCGRSVITTRFGHVAAAEVLLLDPMLATGNSACEAASILKVHGARSIQFLAVVACPTGIEQFHRDHPDIPIITAAIDPELDDHGYIVPGLGTRAIAISGPVNKERRFIPRLRDRREEGRFGKRPR